MALTHEIGRAAWDSAAHPRAPAGAAAGGQFAAGSGRAAPSNTKPVGSGEKSTRVSDLQKRLNALGTKPPLKLDGIYGPKTRAAVIQFQKAHGLKPDGLVGPLTTKALRTKPAAAHKPPPKAAPAKAKAAPAQHTAAKSTPAKAIPAKTAPVAKPATRAMTHEPIGKPGGPGLWGMKGAQIPAFMQHIRNDIMKERGMPEEQATAIAVAQCKKLAAKGNREAIAAVAEWEQLRAKAKATRSEPMSDDHDDADAQARKGRMRRTYDEWIRPAIPIEDIHIVSRAEGDGSGCLVEAYATVFEEPAEIRDEQGHYTEVIDRTAFDHTLGRIRRSRGGFPAHVKVLYNHGKTMEGMPAPEFQLPLGVPEDIRPETRGLLTRTKFDTDDPFTERVLSKVKSGAITSYSFVGGIMRSNPELQLGAKHRGRSGALTTVRRMILGLREYGPVLFPAYTGAEILGVRMSIPGSVSDDELDSTEGEEYVPDMEGDVAGGTPEEVHPSREHAHRLLVLRTQQMCRDAGIASLKGGWNGNPR